jgi:hypothetical protein
MDNNAPTFENRKPSRHQKYGDQNKYIFKDSYLLLREQAGTKLLLAVTQLFDCFQVSKTNYI